MVDVSLEDNSKVSLRDIYVRLCMCRDFEIKLQWERAVFLTAFLIACFAGYGSFLLSVHQYGAGAGNLSPLVINGTFITLTFVGLVLSLLWILMAKGSKAWYEHYEQAIAAFAINQHVANANVSQDMMAHTWYKLPGIKRDSMSNWIFSLNGGGYSVSKIVIAIGICSFVNWSILFLIHLGIAFWGPVSGWDVLKGWDWVIVHKPLGYCCVSVVTIIGVPLALTQWLKSGYFKKDA